MTWSSIGLGAGFLSRRRTFKAMVTCAYLILAAAKSCRRPPAPPAALLGNLSTRLLVETGDNVLIGGFIVTGTQPKKVIVRAIGPSLPIAGALADPVLELRDSSGVLIRSNDNWRSDQEAEIMATT